MLRIFTAFPLPNETAEAFLQLSNINSHLEKFRWTPRPNLHITLFFIGEVEEINLGRITENLEDVINQQQRIQIEFDEIIFKGRKHPSMLWAAFKKNEMFSDLSNRIYQSVKNFMTIIPNHLDPIPHCTLARLKPGVDVSTFNKTINISQKEIVIDSAELWQTIQTKEGVRYDSLKKFLMKD
jgi:2'-5' RNA ligase